MTRHVLVFGLTLAAGMLLFAGRGFSQEAGKGDAKKGAEQSNADELMKAYMRDAQPGPAHKLLEKMVGKWTASTKTYMDPNTPTESVGKCEAKLAYGGRFLVQEEQGECMGQPTNTTGVLGYDNFKKQYEYFFYGDVGTSIYSCAGTMEGKVLTLKGRMSDAMGDRPVRFVLRFESDDKHVIEGFDTIDGKEVKVIESVFTRQK